MPVVIGPAVAGSDDGGLHAVVEDGFGCTPHGRECTIVATQDRGQFPVRSEPSPEPPAAAHEEQEEVNPVLPAGFIGEGHPGPARRGVSRNASRIPQVSWGGWCGDGPPGYCSSLHNPDPQSP